MPRRYAPKIEPNERYVQPSQRTRTYTVDNGSRTSDTYKEAMIQVLRTEDGQLIIDVYSGDPGVEVHLPNGVRYTFTGEER